MDAPEKRRIIEKRIIRELTQYKEQHNAPIAMNILSAKYARACVEIGGFPEVVEALRLAGIVRVEYTQNGARSVALGDGIKVQEAPKIEWF